MTPKTQSDLGAVVVERQVRHMNDEVEQPMRKHRSSDNHERDAAPLAEHEGHDRTKQSRERERAEESMGVWHVIEIERAALCERRDDSDFLNSGQHQTGPSEIHELNGDEQHPERDRRSYRFAGESRTVMTDEHAAPRRSPATVAR